MADPLHVTLKGGYLTGSDGEEYLVLPDAPGTVQRVELKNGRKIIHVRTLGLPTGEETPEATEVVAQVEFRDLASSYGVRP